MRKLMFFVLLASVLLLSACSGGGGSDAPSDTNAHPQSWFSTHAAEVTTSPDYGECKNCHGANLTGSGEAVSCYSCHSYNAMPPFSFHPESWTDDYLDHRAYASFQGNNSCTACHGSDLRGYQTAPSCYSNSFNGASCHADGPQGAPHPIDDGTRPPNESYLLGANHGPDAKSDLTDCQKCHGQPGGPGSNPLFNIGIVSAGNNGCESCHGAGYAHPQNWSVPDSRHNDVGNIANACTLCHGVDLNGGAAVSCFDCHTADPAANPDGCVSCHNVPPDSGPPSGNVSPNLAGQHGRVGHSLSIDQMPLATCDRCHSGAGAGTDKHFDMEFPADLTLPLDPQDTIVPVSDGSNVTCNGNCHIGGFLVPHNESKWY